MFFISVAVAVAVKDNNFTRIESGIHMSLIPLFMVHDDNLLWTPKVNYHDVRVQEAIAIIDFSKERKTYTPINNLFCAWVYEVVNGQNPSNGGRLQSMTHQGRKTEIKLSPSRYGIPFKTSTIINCISDCSPDFSPENTHKD